MHALRFRPGKWGPLLTRFLAVAMALLCFAISKAQTNQTDDPCELANFLQLVAEGGSIVFEDNCTLTLSNTIVLGGDLEIDSGGFDVTIRAGNSNRLFTVAAGAVVQVSGITLSGGTAAEGGAFYVQEGGTLLLNNCALVRNVARGWNGTNGIAGRDSDDEADDGKPASSGEPASGGAIYNLGLVEIVDSVISTNRAEAGDGGAGGRGGDGGWQGGDGGAGGHGGRAHGGAIYNLGTLAVSNVIFEGNEVIAGDGGAGGRGGNGQNRGRGGNGGLGRHAFGAGIFSSGTLLITNCTFALHSSIGGNGGAGGTNGAGLFAGGFGIGGPGGVAYGGGIYTTQEVFVVGTTFSGNAVKGGTPADGGTLSTGDGSRGAAGGAAAGAGMFNAGSDAIVVNSTFYVNHATGGPGARGGDGGFVAGDGGDGGDAAGGALYNSGSVYTLNCTFYSGSAIGGTNGVSGSAPFQGDPGTRGRSLGGNLRNSGQYFGLKNTIIGGHTNGANGAGIFTDEGHNISSDGSISLTSETSRRNTDPRLAPFGDYGGLTYTMLPLAGSLAINAGDSSVGLETDQRDFPRGTLEDPEFDIGSVEGQVPVVVLPATSSLLLESRATVTAEVTGEPPIYYQWTFHGTNVPGAVSPVLTLRNVQPWQAGTYELISSNAFGVIRTPVNVIVGNGVRIVTQPASQLLSVGGTATFNVEATGDAPIGYQWFFQGARITNATANVFTIPNVQTNNAGSYSVTVTNPFSSVTSTSAVLRVMPVAQLSTVSITSTNVTLAFPAQTGVLYVLQYKDNILQTNWINLRTNVPSVPGTMMTIDAVTTNVPSRFYRLQAR